MSDNEDRSIIVNFLAGVGVGALAGAAVALLLAPKSGEQTREDVKQALHTVAKSAEDLGKRSGELVDAARTKVQQAYEAGKEQVKKAHSKDDGETATEA